MDLDEQELRLWAYATDKDITEWAVEEAQENYTSDQTVDLAFHAVEQRNKAREQLGLPLRFYKGEGLSRSYDKTLTELKTKDYWKDLLEAEERAKLRRKQKAHK